MYHTAIIIDRSEATVNIDTHNIIKKSFSAEYKTCFRYTGQVFVPKSIGLDNFIKLLYIKLILKFGCLNTCSNVSNNVLLIILNFHGDAFNFAGISNNLGRVTLYNMIADLSHTLGYSGYIIIDNTCQPYDLNKLNSLDCRQHNIPRVCGETYKKHNFLSNMHASYGNIGLNFILQTIGYNDSNNKFWLDDENAYTCAGNIFLDNLHNGVNSALISATLIGMCYNMRVIALRGPIGSINDIYINLIEDYSSRRSWIELSPKLRIIEKSYSWNTSSGSDMYLYPQSAACNEFIANRFEFLMSNKYNLLDMITKYINQFKFTSSQDINEWFIESASCMYNKVSNIVSLFKRYNIEQIDKCYRIVNHSNNHAYNSIDIINSLEDALKDFYLVDVKIEQVMEDDTEDSDDDDLINKVKNKVSVIANMLSNRRMKHEYDYGEPNVHIEHNMHIEHSSPIYDNGNSNLTNGNLESD